MTEIPQQTEIPAAEAATAKANMSPDSSTMLDSILSGESPTPAVEAPAAPEAPEPSEAPPVPESSDVPEVSEQPAEAPATSDTSRGDAPPADVIKSEAPAIDDADPVDPPREVKEGDQKAVNAWTHLKRDNKAKDAEIRELKEKLQVKSKAPEDPDAMAELQARLDEAEDRIGQLDVTQTKAFRDQYVAPIETAFVKGIDILQKSGRSEQDAIDIMREVSDSSNSVEDIQDIVSGEPVAVQGMLLSISQDISKLKSTQTEAVKNWQETRAAMEDDFGRDAAAELTKAIVKDTESAVNRLKDEGSWAFITSDSDDDWNEAVYERINAARGKLREASPEDVAKLVLEGTAAPFYRGLYEDERARADALEAELTKRVGAMPGLRAGATPVETVDDKPKAVNPDNFLDQMFPGNY